MANHKSAAKRARQTVRKTATNNRRRSSVRTFEKNLVTALTTGKVKELPALLSAYMSQVTRAAKSGVVKKETASRKISRLATRVQAALAK